MRRILATTMLLAMMVLSAPAVKTEEAASEAERPQVEVVFVLDTTGSMGGLIQAAKEKIWAIANTLASTKPAPDIKMGLVGYRDRGDIYITKLTDLTDDLDAVYEQLMGFAADGGGDTPESVNQALNEAVTKINWSKDGKAYRVIFLVGDCPPHMDYADDVKYSESCKAAATAGITINSIQCGNQGETQPIWTDIANRAEGRYFRVEQSGGAILAATPFDAELAELSKEFEGTRVYYGDAEVMEEARERKEVAGRISEEAPAAAKASRAVFGTSAAGDRAASKHDLVAEVATGAVKLEDVKAEELPEEIRKMSPEERNKYLKEQQAKREKVQARIKELADKRQALIEEQIRKSELKGKQSLDFAIFECIQKQAAKKGIIYEGGPSF
ncbi:MAG: vWA domain-containing protein [bacterium]|nr:vWA domain-containing protein [bacterium]